MVNNLISNYDEEKNNNDKKMDNINNLIDKNDEDNNNIDKEMEIKN